MIVPLRRHQDIQSPINSLPRRSLGFQKMHSLHKLHRATDPMYAFEEVRDTVPQSWVVREVPSSACHAWWSWFTETRISSSQWTTGNVMFCVLYLLLNGVALLLAPTFSLVRGLGSLAVANTIFLVIPAVSVNITFSASHSQSLTVHGTADTQQYIDVVSWDAVRSHHSAPSLCRTSYRRHFVWSRRTVF